MASNRGAPLGTPSLRAGPKEKVQTETAEMPAKLEIVGPAATHDLPFIILFLVYFSGTDRYQPAKPFIFSGTRTLLTKPGVFIDAFYACSLAGTDEKRPKRIITNVRCLRELVFEGLPFFFSTNGATKAQYHEPLPHSCGCSRAHARTGEPANFRNFVSQQFAYKVLNILMGTSSSALRDGRLQVTHDTLSGMPPHVFFIVLNFCVRACWSRGAER